MNVDKKTAKHVSEINGNKIYLCSASCKQQFEQNPSKYGHHQLHQKATSFYNVNIQYDPYNPQAHSTTKIVMSITDQFSGDIVKEFETIHDKLMHLIIVNKDLSYFTHIHPIYETSNNTFTIFHKFPESGEYKMWVDFKPKEGSQTLVTFELKVLGNPIHNPVSVAHDMQYLKSVEGQYQISLTVPNEIRIDEDISINFYHPILIANWLFF